MVTLLDDGLNVLPPLGFGVDPETGLDDIATPTAIEPDPDATADAAEFEAAQSDSDAPKKRTRRTKTSASAATADEAETTADSPEAVDAQSDDTTGEETE